MNAATRLYQSDALRVEATSCLRELVRAIAIAQQEDTTWRWLRVEVWQRKRDMAVDAFWLARSNERGNNV